MAVDGFKMKMKDLGFFSESKILSGQIYLSEADPSKARPVNLRLSKTSSMNGIFGPSNGRREKRNNKWLGKRTKVQIPPRVEQLKKLGLGSNPGWAESSLINVI